MASSLPKVTLTVPKIIPCHHFYRSPEKLFLLFLYGYDYTDCVKIDPVKGQKGRSKMSNSNFLSTVAPPTAKGKKEKQYRLVRNG